MDNDKYLGLASSAGNHIKMLEEQNQILLEQLSKIEVMKPRQVIINNGIQWEKYDKENPPQLYKKYLVYDLIEVRSAYFDKTPLSDEPIWLIQGGYTAKNVTHYAEINLPL